MKAFLAASLLLAYVCLVNSEATNQISYKLRAATKKCAEEHNVDLPTVESYVKLRAVPDNEKGKCAVLCYFQKMGYVTDGKFNTAVVESSNKLKWTDSEIASKATNLFKKCLHDEISKNENIDCDAATKMSACLKNGVDKHSIPLPVLT